MLQRKMVFPVDLDRFAAERLEGWTGILPFISPQSRGWKLGMYLLLEFQHPDVVNIAALACFGGHEPLGNRQGIYISVQRFRRAINGLSGRRLDRLSID